MDSKMYWRKRESDQLTKNIVTEEEYVKKINGYYDYMMDQVQKEINGFYAKYAKSEGITLLEAKRKVSQLDIEEYERKAKRYVANKTFTKEANEEMQLYNATMKINRLELLKANIGIELVDGHNDLQQYFDQILTGRTLSELERQAGILGKTIQDNQKAAHAIVNASFNNARFSDRIWMYQDMMKGELSKLLQTGLIQGKNPRQLAVHLRKLFGIRKSDAERLMRTELARVQTAAQKQSFERNEYTKYEFIALGSACSICAALNGEHFEVKNMMPGANAPPLHPNCRCSVAAYAEGDDYEKWLDFLDYGGTTDEWNALKRGLSMESDIGKSISDMFTGISKQQVEFNKSLEGIPNQDIKRLLKEMTEEVAVKRSSGRRSKYSVKDKTVHLARNATLDTLAHELFHAMDDKYGLTKSGMFSSTAKLDYNKLQNLSKGYGKSIEEMLYSKYKEAFNENEYEITFKREYRGISDIINGMSGGDINMGFWHDSSYWKQPGKVEAEMFAQLGRSMYNNKQKVLDMIKDIFPESYNEFMSSLERIANNVVRKRYDRTT